MDKQEAGSGRWLHLIVIALAVACLALAWRLLPVAEWIEALRTWVAHQGILGHVVFAAIYAAAAVALAPGSLLTLAAGLAFGLTGFFTVIAGATVGAGLAFLVGRYFARAWVERQTSQSRLFTAIDRAIEEEGWKIVGLMRLSPLVPFNLQNYFFGVTKIGFWPYLLTSFIGIMPGTLLYVWIGSLGAEAGSLSSGGGQSKIKIAAFAVGLIATLVVTVLVSRKASQKLKEVGIADENKAAEASSSSPSV